MGWTGKILRVDLSSGTCEAEDLNMEWAAQYLGQRGLASKYLSEEIDAAVDALSPDNKFIMVNKAKAAHSNVKPEEMIGKTDFDFLPEEQATKASKDDLEVMQTGKFIINKIEKLTGASGHDRWVFVTKIPRFDSDGNIIGTMGISRDVTEWKRLEEIYKKEITQQ